MIDLIIIVVSSLVLVPLAGFTTGALRIILGLLFLLFSPGYSLVAALFPRKTSLGNIERITLSLGISVAVVPLIGMVLSFSPWGIRLWPVLISVLVFIIIASVAALLRRRGIPSDELFYLKLRIRFDSLRRTWVGQRWPDRILNLLMIAVILGTVGTLIFVSANLKTGEKFTEFTVLGTEGRMDDYPRQIILGESAPVTLNIINREHEQANYRIEINIDGQAAGTVEEIVLEDKEEWEGEVYLTPAFSGDNQTAEFLLFKEGAAEAYRSLHIRLNVIETD